MFAAAERGGVPRRLRECAQRPTRRNHTTGKRARVIALNDHFQLVITQIKGEARFCAKDDVPPHPATVVCRGDMVARSGAVSPGARTPLYDEHAVFWVRWNL